jgi:hypothetical protein
MAKGIYERKGKNGDVTYYIRYQFLRAWTPMETKSSST